MIFYEFTKIWIFLNIRNLIIKFSSSMYKLYQFRILKHRLCRETRFTCYLFNETHYPVSLAVFQLHSNAEASDSVNTPFQME